ncbi:MAG: sigma-54-dependent Fis family transcriptional regulator [Syntrophobacterales bacterium]|nr:MAG: sigma-54-dependent Fis family transcriptional regulator [Syntrophobacterales bacterium]
MDTKIMIVDDEEVLRRFLKEALTLEGYEVRDFSNGMESIRDAKFLLPEIVLLDLVLPDMDGLEVLRQIKEVSADSSVVIMTAYGSVRSAIDAIKIGATDYLTKPFDLEELKLVIGQIEEKMGLKREIARLREINSKRQQFDYIPGRSPKMRRTYRLVEKVAQSPTTTVLIEGESGTGKEVIANLIHYLSDRAEKPFIPLNCSAIPDALLESELFGYEAGAFTDAKRQKRGILELADGGTLFLDEIGEITPAIQVKLLRVLENSSFRRVGGVRDIEVDIRIIAATNNDLRSKVERGDFREDLFYRLYVMPIELPPLRERREDILIFANAFLDEWRRALNRDIRGFAESAQKKLVEYSWPGNIRELKNIMERAVILARDGIIRSSHLLVRGKLEPHEQEIDPQGIPLTIPPEGIYLQDMISRIEKTLITKALEAVGGNQVRAAKLLHIPRHVLIYQMKKFNIKN